MRKSRRVKPFSSTDSPLLTLDISVWLWPSFVWVLLFCFDRKMENLFLKPVFYKGKCMAMNIYHQRRFLSGLSVSKMAEKTLKLTHTRDGLTCEKRKKILKKMEICSDLTIGKLFVQLLRLYEASSWKKKEVPNCGKNVMSQDNAHIASSVKKFVAKYKIPVLDHPLFHLTWRQVTHVCSLRSNLH